MKSLTIDSWSRRGGPLERLDARAKLLAVLITLGFLGTSRPWGIINFLLYFLVVALALIVSRLSLAGLLRRLSLTLPFPALFGLMAWLSTGDAAQAAGLLSRSMLSAALAIIFIGVTPAPALFEGLERLGAPQILMSVAQFLYRYLFVLFGQSGRMRNAAACRGGRTSARSSGHCQDISENGRSGIGSCQVRAQGGQGSSSSCEEGTETGER